MAKTTFNKVTSQDILSAHINGLANGINNLETALNMGTSTISGHLLTAVNDMEEIENRNRIYEGTIRNWTTSPIVKRNGTVVSSSEYVTQPAFGVVVFHNPQSTTDVITVDITYINDSSVRLEDIENDVSTLKTDVEELKERPVSSGSSVAGVWGNNLITTNCWLSNYNGALKTPVTEYTTTSGIWDLIPIVVYEQTTFDKMKIMCSANSSGINPSVVLSLYSNRTDLDYPYPNKLLAKTDVGIWYNGSSEGWLEIDLKRVDGSGTRVEVGVTVEPGIYWLGKITTDTFKTKGFSVTDDFDVLYSIAPPNGTFSSGISYSSFSEGQEAYAIRYSSSWSNGTPVNFPLPSSGNGFYNAGTTNMFIRKSK